MKREYYILAGDEGMKEKLIEAELEISPVHLLVVKENSVLGKQIKKEAQKRFKMQEGVKKK